MKTLLASVAAIGLMGGAALAQQIILVPQDGTAAGGDSEQRFILVPAPRFERGPQAGGDEASMALDLYRRGYQRGMADAQSATRPQMDPAAIERIGRELFERGYVLGLMQGQVEAAAGQAGQQQSAQQQEQTSGEQNAGQQQVAQATQEQDQQLVDSQVDQAEVPEARIGTQQSEQHGEYLVDTTGAPVYMFTADEQGQGDTKAVSNCYDECAQAWPPVLTRSTPVEATGSAESDLLGTIERKDGFTQVTYNGWPLYLFVKDQGADQPTGQDVHGFGGEWYLLKPGGEKVDEE